MLTLQTTEKEQLISALTAQITEKEQVITEKEQAHQALAASLVNKERELQEIYHSKAWRLILFLRRIRLAILPHASTREHLARFILKGYRTSSQTPLSSATISNPSPDPDTSQHATQVPSPDPIIVHQMGKVGSKTIELSLREAYQTLGIDVPIYHVHMLNNFDEIKQYALQNQSNSKETLDAIKNGENLRKQIDDNPAQHWNLITLVRDPIARNVGTFFHNLPDFIPDWQARSIEGKLEVRELQELLINISMLNFERPNWFDVQLKAIPAFGIDVYAEPFPHEVGYKIYPGTAQARLLLLRLEDLHKCAKQAMHEFLGLEHFTLHNTNIGEEKEYADLYRNFKSQPLPMEYVQTMYQTTFARHFYTDAELLAFARRWTQRHETELAILS